jgi:hypothetical protein
MFQLGEKQSTKRQAIYIYGEKIVSAKCEVFEDFLLDVQFITADMEKLKTNRPTIPSMFASFRN